MKKLNLLIIFLFPVLVYSQMLINTNMWNDLEVLIPTCKSINCEGKSYITHSYSLSSDTTINGNSYSIILDTYYQQEGANQASYKDTAGFMRQIDKKVYYYSKYNNDEVLIYDFGLTIGETFIHEALTFTVSSIDSIDCEGEKHLTLHLNYKSDSIEWIEGIGAKQGFLYTNYYFFESKLLCFERNNILKYKNELALECIVTMIASINEINNTLLTVYPNPANDIITIVSADKITEIIVSDISGKLIFWGNPNQMDYSINISHLEKGIYILRVNNQVRKIIKE